MMTLNEIRKLRGMTLSEFSRKSGLSPHTARNLMGYRELYGNLGWTRWWMRRGR